MNIPDHDHDLHSLIKGLTGNEKSYYKKLSKRHANNNRSLHLQMFDIIEKNQYSDDARLQKSLGVTNASQYSTLKNYLTKDLLDSIVFMKRNDELSIQLGFMVAQLEQLIEKKLLRLAKKHLKRSLDIAVAYDDFDNQVRLLHLQNRMLQFKSYKEYKAESLLLAESMQRLLQLQHTMQQLYFYLEQIQILKKITMLRLYEEQADEVLKIKHALEQLRTAAATNKWTLLLYNNALALCEHSLLEFYSCRRSCDEMLKFWKNNPSFAEAYPSHFLNSANTSFYNGFAMQEIDGVTTQLEEYKKLADKEIKNDFFKKQWEIIAFNTHLKINHKTTQYDNVAQLVSERGQEILGYAREVISPAEMLNVMGSIAISYFVTGDTKKADELCIDMKELNHEVKREDILYMVLLFHPLVLFEGKEFYRMDHAIEAAYHSLYANKKLRPFEKEILLFMKKLSSSRTKSVFKATIINFLKKLDEYQNDPVKKLYFLYFNYYGWLESKALGLSYRKYMEEKIASFA